MKDLRPSHLLHFAWYVTPGKFWTSPENIDWLQASLDLVTSFLDCGGERSVIAGTCAEYDWTGNGILREIGHAHSARISLRRQQGSVADGACAAGGAGWFKFRMGPNLSPVWPF